jgi:uncharacterized membrane protein (UPF0127 family)
LTISIRRPHFAVLAMVLLAGCREQRPAHEPGTVDMKLGTKSFRLYVADNEPLRRNGLMNRDSLEADRGMLFVFPDEQPLAFWMKNTRIPLDIIYINSAGKVVSIKHGKPMQESPTIPSDAPAKYTIELNDGAAAAAGLKAGDPVDIPAAARNASE